MVTILVATTIIEITRLYLGYLGNLTEKVPELAGFWLLTVLLQLPMQGFLLFNEDLVILPMERAANVLMVTMVLLELVIGFIALRKITRHQAKKFHLHQLSTGELLRKEIKNKTELGNQISSIMNAGNLVSDNIVSDLIERYISNPIYKSRLIFDGYPRNLNQAKNLNSLLTKRDQKIDIVLKLSVSLETIKKRISERKNLEKRADDNEVIAVKRYQMYEKNIDPILGFYKETNLLKVVNGETSISKISDEISRLIEGIKG